MDRVLMIPRRHQVALERLARLEDDDFAAILKIVGEPVSTFRRGELVSGIVSAVATFDAGDAQLLLASVLNAQTTRQRQGWSPVEAAEAIADASDVDTADLGKRLVQRLVALFDLPNLFQVAKAIDLLTEHEHVFHDARIVTDIRPIFSDERHHEPIAAMIVQQMKIEFHDVTGIKAIFLALDAGDLRKLGEIIDRAQEKHETLRSVIAGMQMPLFELGADAGPS
jgi:hypothetical protein